jgi:hypothetical protein
MLLRVFGDHVDGPLPAWITRVRGDVESDALSHLQHLETAIGDRRVMEKKLATPRITVWLDEPKPAIAKRPDRTGCHRLGLPSPAALLARRPGGARTLAGASPLPVL